MIRVRLNLADLDYARQNLVTRQDWDAVAQLIRSRILERTARGVDAQGQPFAPYSASYDEAKREQLGSSGVNLTVSGEMLRAITYEVKPGGKGVSLFFAR
jgi:hypothetical protein